MSTATRRALYGKLAADGTLTGLLGTPPTGYSQSIFHYDAPQTASYPLVVISMSSGTPTEAFGSPSVLETEVWQVKAIDRNATADTAEAISSRIRVLLNDAALSLAGGSALVYCRRQSDIDYPETVEGVDYRHAGSLFRLVFVP